MRFRTTIILFGVLLALVAVILLSEPKKQKGSGDGRAHVGEGKALIRGLENAGAFVSEIRWSIRGEGTTTVRRDPGSADWYLVLEGSTVPCDSTKIEEILLEARMCTIVQRIAASEVSQQRRIEYWLDPPSRTVELVIEGRREVVYLGAPGVMREVVYASREGEDDVYLVDYGLADALTTLDAADLRRRRIMDYRVSEVVGIDLEADGEPRLRASRKSARFEWRASVPFEGYLDPIAMDGEFLGQVLGLEAARFALDGATDADLPRFGLDSPRYRLTLRRSEELGGGAEVLAVGGDDTEARGCVFVRVEGRPHVYSCAATRLLRVLGKDPGSLRDRNLTRIGGVPVSRLSARYGDAAFEAVSEAGGFRLEKPVRLMLDSRRFDDFLRELRDEEVREFVDGPDLKALGLSSPAGEISVWSPVETAREVRPDQGRPEERRVLHLLLGPRLPGGGAYALREGYPGTAFLIGPELIDQIADGHYRFKRAQVFDADFLKKDPVRLVRDLRDGEQVETEWSSDGWSDGVREGPVRAVVLRLTGLTASRWVGPVAGREDEFGLDADAVLRLGVWFRDVVKPAEDPLEFGVVVGKATEGGRFARGVREGKPEPDVFVLAGGDYEVLSQKLK